MKKSTILLSLGLILGSTALAGGAGTPAVKPPAAPAGAAACPTITQIVASDPQFSTLLTAVQAAGLADTLSSGSYTVFAPTNAAFAKVPSDTLSNLLNDPAMLKAVLLYHVVPGKVSAKQVMSLKSAKTANGANVSVSVMGGKVMINTATVIKADVCARNGLVHVIDSVLLPPMAAAPAPAPVAVPAPALAPAAEAPAAAAPATAEFNVSNIPVTPQPRTSPVPAATTETAAPADTAAPAAPADTTAPAATTTDTAAAATGGSIYDVIVTDERFSTLANFLSDTGLDETLMGGEFTIFAPTNDAFAKLDDATLAVLASDPELLKKILLYHVVAGKVPASQVVTSTQLASAEGSSLSVTVAGSDVTIGTAKVLATDIAADNGIIHAIDTVLVPADVTIPAPTAVAADTTPAPAPAPVAAAPAATPAAATPAATTSATTVPAAPATDMAGGIVATNMTIADVINADARFSTLKMLIAQAGGTLNATLASTGPYTVFLPTNSAFAKIPAATLSQLSANREELTRVLTYHIAKGAFKLADASGKLTSVNSAPLALPLITAAGTSKIGDSTVLYGDVQATNGYINVIDTILMPPVAK